MKTAKRQFGILNPESCILYLASCIVILVSCVLYPASVFAAGVSVSVVGTKVGTGTISSWDIGLIKANQSVYSCGASPDVNCADTGDVYWQVTGSSDGHEDIKAIAASSGNWNPGASSGTNVFVLKAYDTIALNNLTPTTIYPQLPANTSFKVGFTFISPTSAGSTQNQQTITITLTATNWTWVCGDPVTVSHTTGIVSPATTTIAYGTVLTSLSGASKCWITQNLGASQQATSATDATDASAGWYWQFNRKQGYAVGPTPAWTITSISESSDWTVAEDPCTILLGTGWRLPTNAEWTTADGGINWINYYSTYNSVLKLHAAGYIFSTNGALLGRGSLGYYSSSTQANSTQGYYLLCDSGNSNAAADSKATAHSIRCIKD